MTVTLLRAYSTFAAGATASFSAVTEAALIQQGIALAAGGTPIQTASFEAYDDPQTKALFASLSATIIARPLLSANRTYYVRKDGSDANDGLSDTAGGAKLTIQAALNAASLIDFNSFNVIIQLRNGTWTERLLIPKMVGQYKTDALLLNGNGAANTTITQAGGYAPTVECIFGALVTVANFKVQATGPGSYCLNVAEGGVINIAGGMEIGQATDGATGGYQIYANNGGTFNMFQPITVSGNAASFLTVALGGNAYAATAITISTPVTYTFGFCAAFALGVIQANNCTFVNPGNVTGPRYATQKNGVIETFGAGATYFPGTVAGSSATGGQYG